MLHHASRSFLRVLCNLRWLAIAGQVITVLVVTGPMQVALPRLPLWTGIAVLAVFNLYAEWRVRRNREPDDRELFAHMLADIIMLAWMVGWSGGVENPFCSLFLMPIALSILSLPTHWIWTTAVAGILGFGISALLAQPLPHVHGVLGDAFGVHKLGMLVSFAVSAAVILVFFARMASAWRESEREIAQLRERFARNEGIIALATHAASVAHELNTPLGTLTLMVEDLASDAAQGGRREEFATMRALLDACRDRVRELAGPADGMQRRPQTGADIERIIEHWRLIRPTIQLRRSGAIAANQLVDAAVGHLIQALLHNAADASEQAGDPHVDLHLDSDGQDMRASIRDYGAGLGAAQPVLPGTLFRTSKPDGMGIGLALSHATVEQLGGTLAMQSPPEGPGVIVTFRLPVTVSA